ncbi:hypothetical protein [Coleofasciculus sp. H7-2]|uniref:hypothetical protein n=1 Tax=Coleofasciculus sp. H7-2 TaxID=3351545 RepID=UPI00366B5515
MLNRISPKQKANSFLAIATILSMKTGLLTLSMPALADTTTSDWSEWIEINETSSVSRVTNRRDDTSQNNCLDNALEFLKSSNAKETGVIAEAAYGRFGNLSAYLICAPSGDRVLVFVSGPTNQYRQIQQLRKSLSYEFRRY